MTKLEGIEGSLDPARSAANKVLYKVRSLGEAVDEAAKLGVVCELWVGKKSIELTSTADFQVSSVVNL